MAQLYAGSGNAALVRKRIGATTLPGQQPLNPAMRPPTTAPTARPTEPESPLAAKTARLQARAPAGATAVPGTVQPIPQPMVPQPQPQAPGGAMQAGPGNIRPIIGSEGSVVPPPVGAAQAPSATVTETTDMLPRQRSNPDDFLTDFGPGNDLRGTQINPMASDRLGGVAGYVDRAASGLQGPDRGKLAADYFSQLEEAAQPARARAMQDVGRRAAALGRLGAGMTTSELGDVESNYQRDLNLQKRGLATDAASRTLEDRLGTFGALSGLEGDLSGREAARREELRGERGYQGGLAQEDIQNQIQQRMLQEALTQGAFGRAATKAGLGLRSAEMDTQQAGDTTDAIMELIRSGALRRSQQTGG